MIVSAKGWIVIPKGIRDRYGLKPGSKVHVIDYGGLSLVPFIEDPATEMRGMFREGPSLTEALLQERTAERERENRKAVLTGEQGRKTS